MREDGSEYESGYGMSVTVVTMSRMMVIDLVTTAVVGSVVRYVYEVGSEFKFRAKCTSVFGSCVVLSTSECVGSSDDSRVTGPHMRGPGRTSRTGNLGDTSLRSKFSVMDAESMSASLGNCNPDGRTLFDAV